MLPELKASMLDIVKAAEAKRYQRMIPQYEESLRVHLICHQPSVKYKTERFRFRLRLIRHNISVVE